MNTRTRIERMMNSGGSKSPEKVFAELSFVCVKEFGWNYEDLMRTPIPFVLVMINRLRSLRKEERAQAKKRRR